MTIKQYLAKKNDVCAIVDCLVYCPSVKCRNLGCRYKKLCVDVKRSFDRSSMMLLLDKAVVIFGRKATDHESVKPH